MKRIRHIVLAWTMWVLAMFNLTTAQAETWRAVEDGDGCLWLRIAIVNNATTATHWSVSNARTAVASTETTATIDRGVDWDGEVAAGATEYVWVYGFLSAAVTIANCDGGASTYRVTLDPADNGDGEWAITVAADGTVSAAVATAAYAAPTYSGQLPTP